MKKTMLFLLLCIFSFVVIACDEVQGDIHQLAIDSISISYETGDSSLAVTKNITLPTTSSYEGVTFSWTSSEPTIISATGVVTRPVGGSNVSVMLILTATYNGEEKERIFYLTVIPLSEEDVLYTVTFNSNGGTAINSVLVLEGETVNAPLQPTRVGFTFDGWYSDAGLSTAWNFSTDVVNDDLTLYAKWNPIGVSFTITFESNGGSAVGNINVAENGKITKPADPTKSGFAFDGWYKESNLTTVWNFTSDLVTSNVTLYAKWVPVIPTFTVTFNSNQGSAVGNLTIEENDQINKPTDPTRVGFTFEGWYKEDTLDTLWDFESDVVTSDITLYAKWEEIPVYYTVSYNSNSGSLVSAMEVLEDELIVKPSDPTRNGYTFLGWYQEASFDTLWNFEVDLVTSDITLYAKWELTNPESQIFNVTFNSNGGNYDVQIEVVEGFTIEEPATPIKTASIFLGWFSDSEFVTEWNFEIDLVSSDITLYAKWEVNISELPKLPTPINGASHTPASTHFGIGVYGPGEEYRNYYANTIKVKFTNVETEEVITDTFNAPYGLGYAYTYGHLDLPMGTYTFGWAAVAVGTTYQDSDYLMFPTTITIAPKTLEVPVLVINQEAKTVSWNLLTNAASYDVVVGDAEYENQTSPFSLDFLTEPGQYSVKVIAYGNVGYTNSEATTTYTVPSLEAEKLATPINLSRNEFTLSWDTVTNAVGYEVRIGEVIKSSATNSFNLSAFDLTGEQTIYVRALGDVINFNDSDESEGYVTTIPGLLPRLTAMTAGDQNGDINGYGNGYYRLIVHIGHPVFATQLDNGWTGQFRITVKQGDTVLGSIEGANGISLHTPGSSTDFYGALLTNGQNYTVEIVLIGDGVAYRDSLPLAINFTFIKG